MADLVVREPDRLVVRPPRTGPAVLLAIALVGVVAGVVLVVGGGAAGIGAGLLLLVFFGASAVSSGLRVVRNRPVLTVTREGVDDAGSIVAAGFLPWSQLGMTHIVTSRDRPVLVITARDPEAVLRRARGARARVGRAQAGLLGSPLAFPSTVLPVPPDDIVDDIEALRPEVSQVPLEFSEQPETGLVAVSLTDDDGAVLQSRVVTTDELARIAARARAASERSARTGEPMFVTLDELIDGSAP